MATTSLFIGYVALFLFVVVNLLFAFQDFNIVQYVTGKDKFVFFGVFFFLMPLSVSFMMFLSSGYYQIRELNNALERNIQNYYWICASGVIRKTSIIYDKLCDVFDLISAYFVLNNLVTLSAFLYFYVFFFYDIYVYSRSPSNALLDFTLSNLLWCFYYTPFVLCMTTLSSWIHSEGCKTSHLVEQLAKKTNKPETLRRSHTMVLQINHRVAKISCGFDINWKTFFALIGHVFYLSIIIIQFYDVANN